MFRLLEAGFGAGGTLMSLGQAPLLCEQAHKVFILIIMIGLVSPNLLLGGLLAVRVNPITARSAPVQSLTGTRDLRADYGSGSPA